MLRNNFSTVSKKFNDGKSGPKVLTKKLKKSEEEKRKNMFID